MLNRSLKYLDLSSEELKKIAELLAEERDIKDHKSMPEDILLTALISSKPVKESKKNKFHKF